MSHDASPNRTARSRDAARDDDTATANHHNASSPARSRSASRQRRKKKSKKKRNPGLAKKLGFITHLLKTLDLVIFAELSALYYMECSLFRFVVRSAGQYMYLTPKDESFPFLMPATRVHVLLVLIPNIICMASHLFGSLPVGPDFHRGYQHGGLIIDFIGQRPPTWRLYYFLADVVILVVQCFMLTVHTEREHLRAALKTFRPVFPVVEDTTARSTEDLDAEERGVLRNGSEVVHDETDGIDLHPLGQPRDGGEGSGMRGDDLAPLLPDAASGVAPGTPLSDIMTSGNAILGEYHVLHSMLSATMGFERTAAHSLQTISYGATMAALQARQQGASVQISSQRSRG
ncbi:hypothetical protein HRG_002744 [Hirsutella rhossiliensis]|uniref:DUF1746 domain-containing protein n=1 Tax=Hirsutella rhossiliensis TaxID=111463 RepID=A0A9P8N5J5_9HYPO|nr:uncharacterized protein HRG_02744 [Hirsutella rhossiliensis]KAH0967335.1 hypothetical protein HRG_02744 [Hirsutella rhossiliensis]